MIDPGHGGDDVGVRSAKGIEEKQLTLDIARRLRALVENRLGLRVILTRDDDRRSGSTSVLPSPTTARPTCSSACT